MPDDRMARTPADVAVRAARRARRPADAAGRAVPAAGDDVHGLADAEQPAGRPLAQGELWAELPPADAWTDGFRPLAASYAAALREVAAGRRRVRVDGREGTVAVGLGPDGDWRVSVP